MTIVTFLLLIMFGFSLNNHAVCMNNNNNNKKRTLDDNNSEQQDNAKKTKEFDNQKSLELSKGLELLNECKKYNPSLKTIETLLEQNADPNSRDYEDYTPLHILCRQIDPSHCAIDLLLQYNADPNSIDYEDYTPLHILCRQINPSHRAIDLLLQYNADPNSSNTIRLITPLDILYENGTLSINLYKVFIKHKIHIDIERILNQNYLQNNPNLEVIKFFIKKSDIGNESQVNRIFLKITLQFFYFPSYEIIKFFIKHKVDINAIVNKYGNTLISSLYQNKRLSHKIFKLFIKHNLNVNDKDEHSNTPLHLACDDNNPSYEIIELLLKLSADVNARDDKDNTPLHNICFQKKSFPEIIELFLMGNANVNAKNNNGDTPLSLVCYNSTLSHEIIKLFLMANANINEKANDGTTVLHWLFFNNSSLSSIKFIIFYFFNEDINSFSVILKNICHNNSMLKNIIFTYLLFLKVQQKNITHLKIPKFINFEIFKFFIIFMIRDFITIKNDDQNTPLMIAQFMKHHEIVSFFRALEEALNNGWDALIKFYQHHV